MEQLDPKQLVEETHELYRKYRDNSARVVWENHVQEDREFRMGKQWTEEEKKVLEKRGQAPIVVNRIHPAVETVKALLTSRKPSFMASAREDSDNKIARVYDTIFEYIWDISDGNSQFRSIIDNRDVGSMGYAFVYQDVLADSGRGEVKFISLEPLDVYVDPNSRDRLFDDAENIIISREYTREQAKKYKPLYANIINGINDGSQNDYPVTDRSDNNDVIFTGSQLLDDDCTVDKIRGYERYQMVFSMKHRVYDKTNGKEQLLNDREFEQYLQQQAFIVMGKIFRDPQRVNQVLEMLARQGQNPEVTQVTNAELIQQGAIDVVNIKCKVIRVICVMGDELFYVRELPANLDKYPIIPFPCLHTGTPFPTSEVRMVKPLQEYINKIRSLIISHASTSTNVKVLIPRGSANIAELEEKWARPGTFIEFDPGEGSPVPVPPAPLPNELYHNERQAMEDINHQFGIYEMMMGDAQAAPQTYKATISLDDYGQRKIRSKLADIESSLRRIAEVMIPFIQQLYTQEKTIRLVQPNNSITEVTLNHKLVDDKSGEIKAIQNDISKGTYDVKVITGSTLPSNRYAELELHMEAYKAGIIDQQEVLKKTDIYDKEGILERISMLKKLQSALEQATKQIKKLQGDNQTLEREIMHAKQDAELAKFKSGLKGTESDINAAKVLYTERLKDSQREFEKDKKRELKEQNERNSEQQRLS